MFRDITVSVSTYLWPWLPVQVYDGPTSADLSNNQASQGT